MQIAGGSVPPGLGTTRRRRGVPAAAPGRTWSAVIDAAQPAVGVDRHQARRAGAGRRCRAATRAGRPRARAESPWRRVSHHLADRLRRPARLGDAVGRPRGRAARGSAPPRPRPGTTASGSAGSTRRAPARRWRPPGSRPARRSITSATRDALDPARELASGRRARAPSRPRMNPDKRQPDPAEDVARASSDEDARGRSSRRRSRWPSVAAKRGRAVAVAGALPGDRAGDPPAVERERGDQVEDQHQDVDRRPARRASPASPETSSAPGRRASRPRIVRCRPSAIPIAAQTAAITSVTAGPGDGDLELGPRRVGVPLIRATPPNSHSVISAIGIPLRLATNAWPSSCSRIEPKKQQRADATASRYALGVVPAGRARPGSTPDSHQMIRKSDEEPGVVDRRSGSRRCARASAICRIMHRRRRDSHAMVTPQGQARRVGDRGRSRLAAAWRSMIASKSMPGGQRAERAAPVAAEARGAEGVGDRRVAVADQQRALQHERHPLDEPARPRLDRRRGRSSSARRLSARGVAGAARRRRASSTSAKKASSACGLRAMRAQDVEALDVARALPDRVERRLAVEARHPGLLDVAVAAEALERLARVRRRRACRSST